MPLRREEIEEIVNRIGAEYYTSPGLILSEDDLKCHIFHKLMHEPRFSLITPTMNPQIRSIAIHSEIPWFNNDDQLRFRPDLTILDPSALSILHAINPGINLPRKGHNFAGDSFILELKFYKGKGGVRTSSIPKILKDLNKMQAIFERNRSQQERIVIDGIMVVFSKYTTNTTVIEELEEEAAKKGVGFVYHEADQTLLRKVSKRRL